MPAIRETHDKVSVEWPIKDLFPLNNVNDCEKRSLNFSLCGVHFFLKIWPNGNTEDDTVGWVSLYLIRYNRSPEKQRISYTIGIRKLDGTSFKSFSKISEFQQTDNLYSSGYGEPKFVRTYELQESKDVLSVDNSLVVYCIVRDWNARPKHLMDVHETGSQTVPSESVEILQRNFKDLLLSERNTDATINVKDQQFHVHRWILAARSPVLSSMFEHDTEEKESGIVNITDLDPEPFKDFLTFLYTGNTDMISSSNAVGLYKAADKYDLNDLKNECVLSMMEELSAESFCDVVILASIHDESKLLENVTGFFIKNVTAILQTSEWQSLMREHTTLANELLIKMTSKK